MVSNKTAKYEIITLGEHPCRKIKEIYYAELTWVKAHDLVAKKFTELKKYARKIYPEKNEIEMLQELNRYSAEDIKEMFDEFGN